LLIWGACFGCSATFFPRFINFPQGLVAPTKGFFTWGRVCVFVIKINVISLSVRNRLFQIKRTKRDKPVFGFRKFRTAQEKKVKKNVAGLDLPQAFGGILLFRDPGGQNSPPKYVIKRASTRIGGPTPSPILKLLQRTPGHKPKKPKLLKKLPGQGSNHKTIPEKPGQKKTEKNGAPTLGGEELDSKL